MNMSEELVRAAKNSFRKNLWWGDTQAIIDNRVFDEINCRLAVMDERLTPGKNLKGDDQDVYFLLLCAEALRD